MVETWKELRENPFELGLGLQDLFAGRDTGRARSAAIAWADSMTRINATTMSPKQARDESRKNKRSGRRH